MNNYGILDLVKIFEEHHKKFFEERYKQINEFMTNYPDSPCPDHLKDDFSISEALHIMCKEICDLRSRVEKFKPIESTEDTMAACDNLYGNRKEWIELRDFLLENNPRCLVWMNPKPSEEDVEVRICYIPDMQQYLIESCPLKWVQERLNDNFDIQRMICGKAHHE